jgi:uncharacterized alpha-E superfamily protein
LLRHTVEASTLVRSGAGISSRVAENLFWFGRYAERCDDTARLLRVALGPGLQDADDEDNAWVPVMAMARRYGILGEEEDPEPALLAAATTEASELGLPMNLRRLERVAFNLRDRMSVDNWRTINSLVQDPVFGRTAYLSETLNWLNRTVTALMTLSGFALDGMTRDNGWRFLSLGRRLERVSFQCLALQTAFRDGLGSGLAWLLELADSIVTYRSRYLLRPEWLPVLDLLVLDAANPRSLAFQARGVTGYLARMEETYGPCGNELMLPWMQRLEVFEVTKELQPENPQLVETVDGLRAAGFAVGDRLTERFFSHAHPRAWASLG